jgi:hypothetical protein
MALPIFGCFVLNACSSIDVSYISRDEMKSSAFAQEKPRYVEKKPLSLGALRLTNKNAKEGDMGQLLILQRKKSVYMAETKIMDTGKKRYFFSLGIDYKSKTPALGFKMEF